MIQRLRSARITGRFALSGRAHPAMLALIVASGALGLAFFVFLAQLRPVDDTAPVDRAAALRSLAVAPFRGHDAALHDAGQRLAVEVARALGEQMPQVRVVATEAGDARLRLEATLRGTDGEVEAVLRVLDARDGRELARSETTFARAQLDSPSATATLTASARRTVTSALFRLAAE